MMKATVGRRSTGIRFQCGSAGPTLLPMPITFGLGIGAPMSSRFPAATIQSV